MKNLTLTLSGALLALMPLLPAAEVVTDGSTGAALDLSGPDYRVEAELGTQAGANLFHSFSRFNLSGDESAVFAGPDDIQNVVSRVTGGSLSEIDGRIVSEFSAADLYLLNPAGVVFGPNATLDVNGSFHAAAAASLRFADDSRFYADSGQTSVFSSARPAAFGFADNPGAVAVHGSQLSLPAGETLTLSGGSVEIDSGAQITLSTGKINLAAAGSGSEFSLAEAGFTGNAGDVTVANAMVQTSGDAGGNVYIRAGQFVMDREAVIQSNTIGAGSGGGVRVNADSVQVLAGSQIISSMKGTGRAGGIELQVSGDVELTGEGRDGAVSALVSRSLSFEEGGENSTPGGIHITAANVTLQDGAAIESAVAGRGNGGDTTITTGRLHMSGTSQAGMGCFITTNTGGTGNGGWLRIHADEVLVENGGIINAGTVSTGHGSPVELIVAGDITLQGTDTDGDPGSIFTTTESRAADAGDATRLDIIIQADRLNLLDSGRIVADTSGPGGGGKINIAVRELNMEKGASISTNAFERGAAGIIHIQAAESANLSGSNRQDVGSAISSSTTGSGASGQIQVETAKLALVEGAQIGTNTFSSGRGGEITITAGESALIDGEDLAGFPSGLFSATKDQKTEAGDAGSLEFRVGDLVMSNKAGITAGTYGPGLGGNVVIYADSLTMTNEAIITAASTRQGDAGKVSLVLDGQIIMTDSNIETVTQYADGGDLELIGPPDKLFIYLINSSITTTVRAEAGDGGNLLMNSEFIVQDHSPIIAEAVSGDGGNINITTKAIFPFDRGPGSRISASSQFGRDGEVTIQTPNVDVSSGLIVLSTQFNRDDDLQSSACTAETAAEASSFVQKEREGVATHGTRDYLPSTALAF